MGLLGRFNAYNLLAVWLALLLFCWDSTGARCCAFLSVLHAA